MTPKAGGEDTSKKDVVTSSLHPDPARSANDKSGASVAAVVTLRIGGEGDGTTALLLTWTSLGLPCGTTATAPFFVTSSVVANQSPSGAQPLLRSYVPPCSITRSLYPSARAQQLHSRYQHPAEVGKHAAEGRPRHQVSSRSSLFMLQAASTYDNIGRSSPSRVGIGAKDSPMRAEVQWIKIQVHAYAPSILFSAIEDVMLYLATKQFY